MVKTRRGPVGLFQLRHGRGHVAPVPRPAVDIAKVAAGAARGHGASRGTRTARRITQAGASSTSHLTDADHGRAQYAAAALGRRADATTKRVPAARLPGPGLSAARLPTELSSPEPALAAGGAAIRAAAGISSARRFPRCSVRRAGGAGAGAGAEPEAVAVARAVAAATTKGGLIRD